MKPGELVEIIRSVPETRLALIDLTWKVIKEKGSLDAEQLSFYRKELEEASTEATAYVHATKEMVWCLKNIASTGSL